MKNGLKRLLCLSLAALMLLAFAACGKNSGKTSRKSNVKKNQIVHVGETVQYGKLEFTFVDYIRDDDSYAICVNCKNNKQDTFYFDALTFSIYADDKQVGYHSGRSYCISEEHGIKGTDGYGYDIPSGREGTLWIASNDVPAGASKVEFDYSLSGYAKEWGKLTFVIDLR